MPGKRILLVEGPDDEHVFKALFGQRGMEKLDEIKPQGNVEQLLENFPVRLKESDIAVLGVVLDADTNLAARWDALRHRLKAAGFMVVPDHPSATGTILEPPADSLLPRFGVWIMPNNQTAGILEDFLRFLVPVGNRLFNHAQESVAGIPNEDRRFGPLAEPKVLIHTWLAWQAEPGRPLGQSSRSFRIIGRTARSSAACQILAAADMASAAPWRRAA